MEPGKRIITIDGPAGAGKSTAARALATRLGWTYLDTGAMYRAVGLAALEEGADVSDEEAMTRLVAGLDLRVATAPETTRVYLAGREVTSEIRQPHISGLASAASALGVVRRAMVDLQRRLGAAGKVVAEGRDMGTVVFPQAGIKFFLDASLEERARRRFEELQASDKAPSLAQVTREISRRDEADSSRALAPLRPAEDAVLLDSTRLSQKDVLARMLEVIKKEMGISAGK